MKKISSKEEKKILLDILIYLDKVCRDNDINYTLYAGTLIGAARHKGFIPWDDDVDVAMLWEDYKKFIQLPELKQNKNFVLHEPFSEKRFKERYYYPYAKLEDSKTIVYTDKVDKSGIFIDVFPLFSFPNEELESRKISRKMSKLHWRVLVNATRYSNPIKKLCRFLLALRYKRSRDKMIQIATSPRDSGDYVGDFFGQNDSFNYKFEKEIFNEYVELPFEGKDFKVVKDYDKILRTMYGNWEVVPPKEKRVTHNLKAYKKD